MLSYSKILLSCTTTKIKMKQFKYQIGCSVFLLLVLASLNFKLEAVERKSSATNSAIPSKDEQKHNLSDKSALEIFRKAYENRYTWNKQFPGYTAVVEFRQGKEDYKGRIRISPDLSVEVSGINNKEASQTVKNQLLMIVVHRRHSPFTTAHKDKMFKFSDTGREPGVVGIIADAGDSKTHYQLADNRIIQEKRSFGSQYFVVETLNTQMTAEGYIPTQYKSTFYDAKTDRIIGTEVYSDSYEKVGDYYFPVSQKIIHSEEGSNFEAEFKFSEIKLM